MFKFGFFRQKLCAGQKQNKEILARISVSKTLLLYFYFIHRNMSLDKNSYLQELQRYTTSEATAEFVNLSPSLVLILALHLF